MYTKICFKLVHDNGESVADYANHCNKDMEKKMGKALLGAADVAKQLGISRRTFETLVKEGNAPGFVWIGHQRRWRPEDIERFIERKLTENGNLRVIR